MAHISSAVIYPHKIIITVDLCLCSYGHYVEGTGSVLQSCVDVELESVFKSLELLSEEDKLKQLLRLKLRYFKPREIANLMGFPEDFSKTLSDATLYMLTNQINKTWIN